MQTSGSEPEFTGEFFIPGKSGERIEADHMERYRFASGFAQGRTVLDIACGVGFSAPLFLAAGAARYVGVDLNEQLIQYAARTYGSEKARFVAGDICTYEDGERYDLVVCYETIEHIKDYRSALGNLYHLLNTDGVLIISSPHRLITSPRANSLTDKPSNEFHIQEFTPEELLPELKAAGFSTLEQGLYGQRQRRRIIANRVIRRIVSLVFGNPNMTTSPQVTPVIDKVPRYFIFVVKKN
ncbi:MAG: class I SAM-dependent methyltransferase [Candidatus Eisenbacteria bacterium]|uniref:Class I SAM-dependent methyltransferase n=1 Tax=Eiseniibacteriota bacterium TaxID=2212470 RepID=A0A948RR93_UNCEI|nr:class I SAM-dependent methyltransferase [Candidatus Eisenbacteria bacterium]MBU1949774.1 class I SAM-dependent methyltransferase [Candidatus Eisenbacteria bacterium]MBU2689415.1 class I SAM-dependent methyltransferase [Candidatus Eisenbacteria bacterium]